MIPAYHGHCWISKFNHLLMLDGMTGFGQKQSYEMSTMTEPRATFLSFLIAPMVPSVAMALSSPGLGGGLEADVEQLAGLSVLFYFYAVVAVGLLGLPAFLLFRHHHMHNLWSATGVSCVLTVLIAIALGSRPNEAFLHWIATMVVTALVGAATGGTFWAVRWCCMREQGVRA